MVRFLILVVLVIAFWDKIVSAIQQGLFYIALAIGMILEVLTGGT